MLQGIGMRGKALGRRKVVAMLAGMVMSPGLALAEHPAIVYMRAVAHDLLNANRQGTVDAFRAAIAKHADLAAIADYSLGQYRSKLSKAQRSSYYTGVETFMARYLADQSREYQVAKYEIGDATADGKDVLIDTRVTLMSGQAYTVQWRLTWRRGRYVVADAKVLGISMVYMQRGLFTSFISKRNGDVAQLIAALNR
jgi:phospholipid transport system substrate-binding protein